MYHETSSSGYDGAVSRIHALEGILGSDAVVAEVVRMEQRLGALRERAMRRVVLLEAVQAMSCEMLVAWLDALLIRVAEGRGASRELLTELALEPAVFEEVDYDTVQEAYRLAREAGMDRVAELFLSSALNLNPTVEEAVTDNEHLDLPLGVRRAAARSTDRFVLDRLVHDRNPRVIEVLLDNPRLVERDVVKIAAMRPTRPEVLEVVARHRRWSSRYRVRKALACNPYTPAPLVRQLVPTLMCQDVRQAVEAGLLDPRLLTDQRKPPGDPTAESGGGREWTGIEE